MDSRILISVVRRRALSGSPSLAVHRAGDCFKRLFKILTGSAVQIWNNLDIVLILGSFLWSNLAYAQFSRKYEGPDDPAGDEAFFRSAYLQGNNFLFYLNNNTSICDTGSGVTIWNRWPNTYEGVTLVHGINGVMAARVYVTGDSIPVTDPEEIRTRTDLDTLYFAQQGFRNRTDMDPTGSFEWGMKPVYGYFNELSESMAMSNDPDSWPPAGWPAPDDQLKWPGEWNGRFGRGMLYADQEAFYVLNDAQDQEYLPANPENPGPYYYPRPGVKIGDKRPAVTIQKNHPWGGIGLRLEVRGFQWNNPQARDVTFFEYTVANISDYDLPEMCFGFYFHPYVGEDGNDDYLYFNKKRDMSYNWDSDGIGLGGLKTCAFGIAYLESPGKPFDGVDNDDDGLVDEKRDNLASELVGPYDGISDLAKFLEFYSYTEDFLHEHYEADEDQDWQDGQDLNNNGVYDLGEDPGDDVGLDGVGPGELNYTAPDEGECNHRPDYIEGVGCEPNFAATDVSESDMLGLTSFHTFDHDTKPRIHPDDVLYWQYFSDPTFDSFQDAPGAWVNLFATGIFPLYKGRTERISMGLIGSYDSQEGLNSSDHLAPILWRKKEIAQIIYESDYRFAQPPKMPTLKATAGDGKVILTWDDVADKLTREPFLRNINDFEGYKLFKATDVKFSDADVITDGYGSPLLKRPVFQCDLINHRTGFTDYGLVDGAAYYLGEDTGLQHFFIDTNVQNGKTYYYAIVAYDYGIPEIGDGIGVAPSENNIVVELDEAEEIKSHGLNVAVVTPHQSAAGYVPPGIEVLDSTWPPSSGSVVPKMLMPAEVKEDHTYTVSFHADTVRSVPKTEWGVQYTTNGYKVYDVTGGRRLVLDKARTDEEYDNAPVKTMRIDSLDAYTLEPNELIETDTFDGLKLDILLNTVISLGELDREATGWRSGNLSGDIDLSVTPSVISGRDFSWEYEIVFADPGVYRGINTNTTRVRDEQNVRVDKSVLLLEQDFNFYVINKTHPDTSGNYTVLDLSVVDMDSSGVFELERDKVLAGILDERERWYKTLFAMEFGYGSEMPQPNDVYRVTFKRPFFVTDSLRFKVLPQGATDVAAIKTVMDSIQVVPNPYVATNNMEPAVANYFLNQRRRLLFTHLPARCEIKIFTVSGILVDEIDVENPADNGTAFWDLTTREGLEVSAGVYVYYVFARETGDEKIGKFSIIK